MIRPDKILNRVNVVFITFTVNDKFILDLYEIEKKDDNLSINESHRSIELEQLTKDKTVPVILMIQGEGVLSRTFIIGSRDIDRFTLNEDIVSEKIEKDNEVVISFMRKQLLSSVTDKLKEEKLPIIETHIGYTALENEDTTGLIDDEKAKLFARLFFKNLKWKSFIEPGEKSNTLAGITLQKLKLVLLVSLLILLLINYFVNDSVRQKYNNQQIEYVGMERRIAGEDKLSSQMQQILKEFNSAGTDTYAKIFDLIGSVVPSHIVLQSMTMNPIRKAIEEGKSLDIRNRFIVIDGESLETEEVTRFTNALQKFDFARHVRLVSLDKNRDSDTFMFKIEVGI